MELTKTAIAILFLLALLTLLHIIQFYWKWNVNGRDGLSLNFGGGIGLLNDFPPGMNRQSHGNGYMANGYPASPLVFRSQSNPSKYSNVEDFVFGPRISPNYFMGK